jgi:hypothetical protein
MTVDPDPDHHAFGVVVLGVVVGFTGRVGVKKKPSAPHSRLVCIHLQDLQITLSASIAQRSSRY